nr:leucine-rich repeat domain-containing protein [uncultured Treponema sp.]
MKPHKNKIFAFVQTKTAALITAALLLVVSSAVGSSSNEDGSDGTVTAQASVVTDSASLILSPDKLTIRVTATTADDSAVTVEGCTETTLASGTETTLHAQGTAVILKGKITELYCRDNQLTALNIQGLSALQGLECDRNQLTAQALTSLLTGLPVRLPSDDAKCTLYAEDSGEGNHTDINYDSAYRYDSDESGMSSGDIFMKWYNDIKEKY